MDIDALARNVRDLIEFKTRVEDLISNSGITAPEANTALDEIQAALPAVMKAASDMAAVVDDLAAIKKDFEPALAWISEQQAKAASEDKVVKAAEAQKAVDADAAEKADDEKEKGVEAGNKAGADVVQEPVS